MQEPYSQCLLGLWGCSWGCSGTRAGVAPLHEEADAGFGADAPEELALGQPPVKLVVFAAVLQAAAL